MLQLQPLPIALAISVSLHLGVGLSLLVKVAPAKQPITPNDPVVVFETFVTSRVAVNTAQLEQNKNILLSPYWYHLRTKNKVRSTPLPHPTTRNTVAPIQCLVVPDLVEALKTMRQLPFNNGTLRSKENLNTFHLHPTFKVNAQ